MKRLLPFLSLLIVLLVSCTPTYIVTFQGGVGGSVSIPGGEYDEGTTVSVSAQPETGYEFQSWSDGSSQNPRTITVTESLNLTAFFNKQQFTVTVSAQGEGSVQSSGGDSQGNFEYGATARFEAIPASGWVFDSWSGDAIGTTNPLSITVDKTQTITAVFKRQKYDLTIIVVGEGTVEETVVIQPGQYDYETVVRLTANPADGWEFSGWSGDVTSEENPIEVGVKNAFEIRLTFKKIPPKITYPLHLESYHNQRSGIAFRFGDYRPDNEISHSTKMGTFKGYFAGGHAYHDVNKDGFQDILVTYHLDVNNSSTDWYINSGDNEHFSKTNLINSPTTNLSSHKILKTDVNNDNLADFILLGVDEREQGNYGGNFTTLLQKQNGTFDLISIDDGKGLWYHNGAAGDLNADGYVDVVTADYIWYGDGSGNFTNSNFMISENYAKDALVYEIVDLNNDGFNDILLGTASFRETNTIIFGNSNGFNIDNEKIKLTQLKDSGPMDFEIYDIDNDGDLDIIESRHTAMVNSGYTELYVYINSSMNFNLSPNYIPDTKDGNYTNGSRDKYGWGSIKFDDIDGDGIDDIVSESYSDGDFNGMKKINGVWRKNKFLFGN